MKETVLFLLLGVCAFADIRKKSVPLVFLLSFILLGILCCFLWPELEIKEILLGIALGVVLLGISFLTRESIGRGDGLAFVATGLFLGGAGNLELLFWSLLLSAIVSLGILIFSKAAEKRKKQIPFLPFVWAGYGIMLLGQLWGLLQGQ